MLALSAHHTNVIYMVAFRCAYGKTVMYMASLVDRLATYLASVVCHFMTHISLGIAVVCLIFLSGSDSYGLFAYPDIETE